MITINSAKAVAAARAAKLRDINAACDRDIDAIRATYPETEVLSWPKQEAEARAMLADPAAHTPLLDAIAQDRGVDRAELASRVIEKSDAFAAFSGTAIGKRQRLEDQLEAIDSADPNAPVLIAAISWGETP